MEPRLSWQKEHQAP